MADNQEVYGKPKMLGPQEHIEIVNGQFVRMPGAPNPDKGKEPVLNTGYQKDDFKEVAVAQGLYGQMQTQPTPQQPMANQPQQATVPVSQTPVNATPVNSVPVSPTNTVAETVGNAVASNLINTVEGGVEMVNDAQDMVNMFIPGNNS